MIGNIDSNIGRIYYDIMREDRLYRIVMETDRYTSKGMT